MVNWLQRTMKIPLSPPFAKGDNYTSLWQRGGGEGFKEAIFYANKRVVFSDG